jgi:hypothetical protein
MQLCLFLTTKYKIMSDKENKITNYIQIGIFLNEYLGIKKVSIDYNDTGHPSNSELLKAVSVGLLKSIAMNNEDVQVQDLLNEINMPTMNGD